MTSNVKQLTVILVVAIAAASVTFGIMQTKANDEAAARNIGALAGPMEAMTDQNDTGQISQSQQEAPSYSYTPSYPDCTFESKRLRTVKDEMNKLTRKALQLDRELNRMMGNYDMNRLNAIQQEMLSLSERQNELTREQMELLSTMQSKGCRASDML